MVRNRGVATLCRPGGFFTAAKALVTYLQKFWKEKTITVDGNRRRLHERSTDVGALGEAVPNRDVLGRNRLESLPPRSASVTSELSGAADAC